jgi:membrane-bound lytic murein transglycosylase D
MMIRSVAPLLLASIASTIACEAQTSSPFAVYDERASRALDKVLSDIERPDDAAANAPQPEPVIPVASPELPGDAITGYANRFWNGRTDDLRAALRRLAKIRPALEQILAEEGVPSQFSAVVLVESGANPVVLSPKSARGLWQFMPQTAARYGLVVDDQRDDRTDLFKSTRAAARYLRELYRTFGEWRLALAAYDAGEGALREAIQRGRSFNFDLLSERRLIPAETRNYVPAVFAAVNLLQIQ